MNTTPDMPTPRALRELTPLEARILGVLVEKQHTVPDTYPLSLNALTAGCNQKTARSPVMTVSEDEVTTALDGLKRAGDTVTWPTTDYETLVDSPIFAGINAQSWDIGQNVRLDVVADKPTQLALAPQNLQSFRNLVNEADALFGARHFDHYDMLLALTDRMGGIGLEHHRSAENRYEPQAFVKWDELDWNHNVVSHEFVHSWNGKFRRPADLWTPDYRTLLAKHPDDAAAHAGLGATLAQLQQPDAARAEFERALALDPVQPDTLANYASLELAANHPEHAQQLLTRAVAAGAHDAATYQQLAYADQQIRHPAEAEAALRSANAKFVRRFHHIETALAARGSSPAAATLAEMEALWQDAKSKGIK